MARKYMLKLSWERWRERLPTATEAEVLAMLREGKAGGLHFAMLNRIYVRYSKLRRVRELRELKAKPVF